MTSFVHHDMQSINSDKDGQIAKLQIQNQHMYVHTIETGKMRNLNV